ncbi:uncharacterized protein LACBIDRAFT_303346 [Laccaria bicolor S238N-H82]|uniref:Predicted protein n=1 Tax=Laccaria bicolor (strain S238N-H82 / ATCC MYA-4686) TaxID=486041 RepID=B0DJC7_LACBS|nr:uncharacterized protein LACBIDRAFT_303346 [Laccaria bicolor S238N-H82]EDR05383.1 predicted protein [Laccaria bicolor S238N-H82]|eukprot:XP_001883941.1 predicted protein [Laccaria bicolor S238N-H82]
MLRCHYPRHKSEKNARNQRGLTDGDDIPRLLSQVLERLVYHNETYHTKEAFRDTPQIRLSQTSRCQFAHSSKGFNCEDLFNLIYRVAFDTSSVDGSYALSSSCLFSSNDFYNDRKVEDLGIGKNAKDAIAIVIVSEYTVVALNS